MLLTVEHDATKGVVELHVDNEGMDRLIEILTKLRARGGHDHLKTPSWGGWELTEEKQALDTELVHHLAIRVWGPATSPMA